MGDGDEIYRLPENEKARRTLGLPLCGFLENDMQFTRNPWHSFRGRLLKRP